MTKNLMLAPILAHLAQIWSPKDVSQVLLLLVVGHCSKLSSYAIFGKLMNQTSEKAKNLIGPDFGTF